MTTSSASFDPLYTSEQSTPRGLLAQTATLIAISVHFAAQIPYRVRRALHLWNVRLYEREFLASLQEYQLTEMGLTFDQRDCEVNKPFWKA